MALPNVKKGSVVAFSTLPSATWYVVVKRDGFEIAVREEGTNNPVAYSDVSLVKQVRT